jgi:hypothetical protein
MRSELSPSRSAISELWAPAVRFHQELRYCQLEVLCYARLGPDKLGRPVRIGWSVFLRIALISLLGMLTIGTGRAADIPPPNILSSIIGKIAPHHADIEFAPATIQPDPICRMQPHEMRFVGGSGRTVGSYSVMLDPQTSTAITPREFFAVLTRITVDTDGSQHTYHPEDPEGTGTCQRARDGNGQETLEGVCAIEKFVNGDAHVFRDDNDLSGADLANEWRDMWPLISSRRLKPVNMETVGGPAGRYMFYWDARQLTAIFNNEVIPHDNNGYPCTQNSASRYAGYFLAATTLRQIGPTREDGCAPEHYLDAETVPYFVLPKGGFGNVRVGDVVIAQIIQHNITRTVFGVVGDAGGGRLGEASVAFNAALLGKSVSTMASMRETWSLDVDGPKVALLVLGGTNEKLNGIYTAANIAEVARSELGRWNGGDTMRRFDACVSAATVNGRH